MPRNRIAWRINLTCCEHLRLLPYVYVCMCDYVPISTKSVSSLASLLTLLLFLMPAHKMAAAAVSKYWLLELEKRLTFNCIPLANGSA